MQNKKIFISGATGFIGSHIAELMLEQGFEVMALKRDISHLWRCSGFIDRIIWTNEDVWESEVIEFCPNIIIHLAWEGIDASDRENWEKQFNNIQLIFKLASICKLVSVKKFIAFGSQAEYGLINGRVNESVNPEPNNAYAVAKIAAQKALKILCEQNGVEWYWLRIFSVFGPRESKTWFIPMMITNLLDNVECRLTGCEQQYDYIYVRDLARMILTVLNNTYNHSGIYNISSNGSKTLKSIITEINQIVNSKSKITFGAIPYRKNQSMHIEGNSELYRNTFGPFTYTDLNTALKETIDYYRLI